MQLRQAHAIRAIEELRLDLDPANLSEEERERPGIRRLPQSLDATLDALEADSVLSEALGPLLVRAYVVVKRLEAAYFADRRPDEEAR